MYSNYEYYQLNYKGFKIPPNQFPFYSSRAKEEIDMRVNTDLSDQLTGYETEIKSCECAIADILYEKENNKEVSSEKTLTYSVSYDTSKTKSEDKKIYEVLVKYFRGTGFLFSGIGGC